MSSKSDVIQQICRALAMGGSNEATKIAKRDYPYTTYSPVTRNISAVQATRVFAKDGFIDRYSGDRLVFPATLRLLSMLLPEEFPYHKNWKMSECHPMYWELFATIDHIHPAARDGENDDDNLVTTSMLRNAAKANWTLEELGWQLHPPGVLDRWDGLMGWYVIYTKGHSHILENRYLERWYRAACTVTANDPN